jgi:hypothetical protein
MRLDAGRQCSDDITTIQPVGGLALVERKAVGRRLLAARCGRGMRGRGPGGFYCTAPARDPSARPSNRLLWGVRGIARSEVVTPFVSKRAAGSLVHPDSERVCQHLSPGLGSHAHSHPLPAKDR